MLHEEIQKLGAADILEPMNTIVNYQSPMFIAHNRNKSNCIITDFRGWNFLQFSQLEEVATESEKDKEIQIKKQNKMTNGMENYNNNHMMRQYWHGKQVPPLKDRFYSGAHSPANFVEDAESSSSSSNTNSPLLTSCSTTPEMCLPPARFFVQTSPCLSIYFNVCYRFNLFW